jgi:hypothetical protein
MRTYTIAGFSVGMAGTGALSGFGAFASDSAPDAEIRIEGNTDDAATLKFAAWVAFSRFALPHGAMPIHASAVVHNGGAVLFLGESGTGKSTHTALWIRHIEGSWLLNDDSPFVRATSGGGIMACGSPWSGKTPCYRPEAVPLRAMVRLRQGPENRIERIGGVRAIGAVWPSCPPQMAGDPELKNMMLSMVGRIVSAVPIFEMECRPDRDAALVAHEAIYNTKC